MRLIMVGINHETAPVECREALSFSESDCKDALAELIKSRFVSEALLISTCNRTELLVRRAPDTDNDIKEISTLLINHITSFKQSADIDHGIFYVKHGDAYNIRLIMAKIYRADEMYDLAEKEYLRALDSTLYEQCNYKLFLPIIEMYMEMEDFKKAKKYTKKYLKELKYFEKEYSCDIPKTEFQKEIKEAEELLDEIKKKK